MVLEIRQSLLDGLGFDLAAAVRDFATQVEAHRFTVDVPAPVAHPLVEAIVRRHGGAFVIVDDRAGEPPPPPGVNVWTPLQFMECFTRDERQAIRAAARQNDDLEDWLDMLRASREVRADDRRTIDGLTAMVEAGLLTQARIDQILALRS